MNASPGTLGGVSGGALLFLLPYAVPAFLTGTLLSQAGRPCPRTLRLFARCLGGLLGGLLRFPSGQADFPGFSDDPVGLLDLALAVRVSQVASSVHRVLLTVGGAVITASMSR
jgi:hypothetical protein